MISRSQAVSYILTVFIADTSTLKNRALMLSFATSPYIITTWIGGPVAQSVLSGPGWRWAFGIFTIIIPVVVTPLAALVLFNDRKARKQGLLEPRRIDGGLAVIAVTSALPKDGKTTTAANLAVAFARRGNDVILADFDFRAASLGEVFGSPADTAGAASIIDDDRVLVAVHDLDLLAGRPGHRAPCPGSTATADGRRPATTNDHAHIATATIAASP